MKRIDYSTIKAEDITIELLEKNIEARASIIAKLFEVRNIWKIRVISAIIAGLIMLICIPIYYMFLYTAIFAIVSGVIMYFLAYKVINKAIDLHIYAMFIEEITVSELKELNESI